MSHRSLALPAISVIIPFRNARGQLPTIVDALKRQTLDQSRFEVIWIDDASRDGEGIGSESVCFRVGSSSFSRNRRARMRHATPACERRWATMWRSRMSTVAPMSSGLNRASRRSARRRASRAGFISNCRGTLRSPSSSMRAGSFASVSTSRRALPRPPIFLFAGTCSTSWGGSTSTCSQVATTNSAGDAPGRGFRSCMRSMLSSHTRHGRRFGSCFGRVSGSDTESAKSFGGGACRQERSPGAVSIG